MFMKLILLVKYCIISFLIYGYYAKFIYLSKIINSFSKLKPLKLFMRKKFQIVSLVRLYKSPNIIGKNHLNLKRSDFLIGKIFLVDKNTLNIFLSKKERVLDRLVNNQSCFKMTSCECFNLYPIHSYFWRLGVLSYSFLKRDKKLNIKILELTNQKILSRFNLEYSLYNQDFVISLVSLGSYKEY